MDDIQKVIRYWHNASTQEFETAQILFRGKKYHHALFFCHLSIEKILKALIVKTTKSAPPLIHDLVRLAEKSGIKLDGGHINDLAEISTFNIQARYDDYKLSFYKKATRDFAQRYLKMTKVLLQWLEKSI